MSEDEPKEDPVATARAAFARLNERKERFEKQRADSWKEERIIWEELTKLYPILIKADRLLNVCSWRLNFDQKSNVVYLHAEESAYAPPGEEGDNPIFSGLGELFHIPDGHEGYWPWGNQGQANDYVGTELRFDDGEVSLVIPCLENAFKFIVEHELEMDLEQFEKAAAQLESKFIAATALVRHLKESTGQLKKEGGDEANPA